MSCSNTIVWSRINSLSSGEIVTTTGTTTISITSSGSGQQGLEPAQFYDCITCLTSNAPPNTDVIYAEGPREYTFNFSPAVSDPILGFWSLGSQSLQQVLSADTNFVQFTDCSGGGAGCPPSYSAATYSSPTVTGLESFGVIQFVGSYSTIKISLTASEFRTDFTWGVPCAIGVTQTPTPTNTTTPTPTPTVTKTPSTPTPTPTNTPTKSVTPSKTPTNTPSPNIESVLFRNCCNSSLTIAGNVPGFIPGGIILSGGICYYADSILSPGIYTSYSYTIYSNCDTCNAENPCPTPTPTPSPSVTPSSSSYTYFLQECCYPNGIVKILSNTDLFFNLGDYVRPTNGSGPEVFTGCYQVISGPTYDTTYVWDTIGGDGYCGPWTSCVECQFECSEPTCPTPTPTPTTSSTTPTPTPTSTFTSTPTNSETSTPTVTATPTFTNTPTTTPTQTSTQTVTPSNTSTPGVSPSPTVSETTTPTTTPTITPTNTNTGTAGATPSPTSTQTLTPTPTFTPTTSFTPTITNTPTQSPSNPEPFDIYAFRSCCDPSLVFRYNNVEGTLIVGQIFWIQDPGNFDGCAEVLPYVAEGEIYYGVGVSFIESIGCDAAPCPTCPTPTPTTTPSPTPTITPSPDYVDCDCHYFTVSNPFDSGTYVSYVDCLDNPQNIEIPPLAAVTFCACDGSVIGSSVSITDNGQCPVPSETPLPTPSPTPSVTVSPSANWYECNDTFCLVTYEPSLEIYNGNYVPSGILNGRTVFSGPSAKIYYNTTSEPQWCLSAVTDNCVLAGPYPSESICPDLWDEYFTNGTCVTTTTTTDPCAVFDFVAYFECEVPPTPSITPTNTPTVSPTNTPSPTIDPCTSFSASITFVPYTTTTTTSSTTTTTTAARNVPVIDTVTFGVVDVAYVCPGDTYQFESCLTSQVYYVEPSTEFSGVEMFIGYYYYMSINGIFGCYQFQGTSSVSTNATASGVETWYVDCNLCLGVSPTATPTPTVTPTPAITNSPTPTKTVTVTPTKTPSPTATKTPTPTLTQTPSNTPTKSPTPSITPSATANQVYSLGECTDCFNNLTTSKSPCTAGNRNTVCFQIQNLVGNQPGESGSLYSNCNCSDLSDPLTAVGCEIYEWDGSTYSLLSGANTTAISNGCLVWCVSTSGIIQSSYPATCSGGGTCCSTLES